MSEFFDITYIESNNFCPYIKESFARIICSNRSDENLANICPRTIAAPRSQRMFCLGCRKLSLIFNKIVIESATLLHFELLYILLAWRDGEEVDLLERSIQR